MPASSTSTSAARIAANRQNAQQSTGPKTAAGKARSRANAVKHGLTGAGIALPGEDRTAVEGRFLELQEELAPQTTLGALLTHQVALMSVRCERAMQQESAAIAARIHRAAVDHDAVRDAEVDALFAAIEADPTRTRRRLLATPAGVDRLIDALLTLGESLARPGSPWDDAQAWRVEAYCGRRVQRRSTPEVMILTAALDGDFTRIDPRDYAPCETPAARREWAIERLVCLIDTEVAQLRAHRATLDHAAFDRDRAGAADRALFDAGREATLARRYEAASSRAFYRALHELRAVEAAADPAILELPEPAPPINPPRLAPAPVALIEPVTEPEPRPESADEIEPNPLSDHDLRPELGSFGSPASAAPITFESAATVAAHRKNRPRVDRASKRRRRK